MDGGPRARHLGQSAGHADVKADRRDELLHFAELTDAWRVFPRIFLFACFSWAVWITYQILMFYFHIPDVERTTAVSTFCITVQGAVLGFVKLVYADYRKDGRKWGVPAQTTTTSTVVQTATSQPIQ